MTSSPSSILVLMLICRWCSNTNGIPHQKNFESSGLEAQLDPAPDPAGGFCQRHKNPAGLGFIGTKYDLLKGNPEGRDSLGGVDPGFDKTKKILQLTTEDGDQVPIQICYEKRNSCSTTKTSKIFGGTKRYQDKLSVDVSAEAGYSGLFDFSFSLSSKYEQMKKSTQNGETIYRDCTEICNKGEARYQLRSVEDNEWTITDEFAADVCRLPVKFNKVSDKDRYFDFLSFWGTHVVVHVVLGTKKITRFRSSLKEFMSYASENVSGSVSVSGGFGGFEASVSVDVNKFEESEETTKEFGEEQLTYNIGGDTLPEPIQVTLLGIEETLKPKFWSNLEKLKKNLKKSCKRISPSKLRKFLKNMAKALKEYPKKMGVTRAKDNPMELQLSWPSGYYSLFAAKQNDGTFLCPEGSGFQWKQGNITDEHHIFFDTVKENKQKIGIQEIDAIWPYIRFDSYRVIGLKYGFCTKTQDPGSRYFSQDWPRGRYCILRKSRDAGNPKCPKNFEASSVMWNDEWPSMFPRPYNLPGPPEKEGTFPDGSYESDKHMKIEFCCRQDGFVENGTHLPLENPFMLVKVQGYPCQKVCGAQLTEVEITTGADNPLQEGVNSAIEGTIKPDGTTSNQRVKLSFCYYQKKDYAKFVSYELVEDPMKAHKAERECQNRKGHLASIHNQKENEDVRKLVGSGSKAWIGLKRRTVRNRPWVWTDGTELDFGDWEPDVTDNENYVSISGDDSSWEAKDKNPKLPFVCKVKNDCP